MYHTSVVFLVAAALLLPPELIVLIPLVQTIPEWLKERYPWPIQVFNISNYTLDALAAWGVSHLIRFHGSGLIPSPHLRFAIAGLAACVVFVAMNHVLVAVILKLGRGHTFRETGLFTAESISIDLVLTILGVSLAAFWHWNPWLIFAALAPLVVVHRSLSVPQLQAEARVDPKTGLYNARYFATTLAAEIARAGRFERPMSLIMADLDLLRDINNSYGHLAGDAVLKGIAEIFRQQLRHYDVPARFGGEEFSILLPETPPGAGDGDRRAHPPRGRRARVRGRDGDRADPRDRVARRRRRSRRTASTRTSSSTRPTSRSTAPSSRAATASSAPAQSRCCSRPSAAPSCAPFVEDGEHLTPLPAARAVRAVRGAPPSAAARTARTDASSRSRRRLGVVVGVVSVVGFAAGIAGLIFGHSTDIYGLLAVLALVGGGQALSFELAEVEGTISVSAVGSLAGAALFDYRAALAARRHDLRRRVERAAPVAAPGRLQHRRRCRSRRSRRRAIFSFALGGDGTVRQLVAVALGIVGRRRLLRS